MFTLAPSLLASDFSNLDSEIKKVYMDGKGCEYLHLDVMDGIFVKNISFGLPVIASIRKVCDIIFDVHLMIVNPIRYIADFIDAGADIITFHYEACGGNAECGMRNAESIDEEEVLKTINLIKNHGVKCSISIKPDTPVDVLLPFLAQLDMVLLMSVEPGFGGQKFIDKCMDKIKDLHKIKTEKNYNFMIEVDGGINFENVKEIKYAGANIIVAGSSVFKSENIRETIERYMNV